MQVQTEKRRRRSPEDSRANILDEAIRIIGERGYYGFAVQDLAKRCGLTTGGLLYHFKTKEDLFLAVLEEYTRRSEAALMTQVANFPADDVRNGTLSLPLVHSLLKAILVQAVSEPELARMFIVLQAEALHHTHPGHSFFCAYQARFLEIVPRFLAAHSTEPVSTARQISATMIGLQQQWFRADYGFDLFTEWDRAVALILPAEGAK